MIDDPEIPGLLKQLNGMSPDVQQRAWCELQRYRMEGLGAAREGEDEIERELRVALARGRLKGRLQKLLGD